MTDLTSRIALVTGASRGIGQAIAIELAARGATVIVNYARDEAGATATVEAITTAGGKAEAVQADVANFAAAAALVKHATDTYGQLDILVNNAGTTRDQLIMMLSEDSWDDVINVNLKSVFNCSKAAVRGMLRKRYGRIINISSVSGLMGQAGQTNYSASKAGIIGFTRALAREIGPRGITVNAIAPGFFPTKLTDTLPDNIRDETLKLIPLGRWGDLKELGYIAAFLASDQAAYITGQTIAVDGGLSMY